MARHNGLASIGLVAALAATPALSWDDNAHKVLAGAALESTPADLRSLLGARSAAILDASIGPDSPGMAATMHGPNRARDLADLIDGTAAAWARKELTPGQLAPRLGTISHLVSDILAPPALQAPKGNKHMLDNIHVSLADDGPSSATNGSALVAECEHLASVTPVESLTLRFDEAYNAILDAWRLATRRPDISWPRDTAVHEVGAPWNEFGLSDKSDERARLTKQERMEKADTAQASIDKAQFDEMGARARYRDAKTALDNARTRSVDAEHDPEVKRLQGELSAAEGQWKAAVAKREGAQELQKEILSGTEPKAAPPELVVLDSSLSRGLLGGTVIARLRNNGTRTWSAVQVIISGTDGEHGRLTLTADGQPAGTIRRYEGRFVTWGDGWSASYAPLAAAPAAAGRATADSDRAAVERLIQAARNGEDVRAILAMGAATPLFGRATSTSFAGSEDARTGSAAQLEALAKTYHDVAADLERRASLDPSAARLRRMGEQAASVAAALEADARAVRALAEGALGTTLTVRVGDAAAGHDWEIDVATNDGRHEVVAVREPWSTCQARLSQELAQAVTQAASGTAPAIDPRPRLAREGYPAYQQIAPAALEAAAATTPPAP